MKQANAVRVGSKAVAAAMVLATVAFLAVPSSVTGSLREDWRRLAGDPGQACFDHEKAALADTAGARFDSYSVLASDVDEVTISYRRKGGEASADVQVVCVLREGRFSAQDTLRLRERVQAASRLDRMMAEFDCLERKKSALRAGKVDEAHRLRCSR